MGYTGKIKIGDAFIWEPRDPKAFERVIVTGFRGEGDDREIQCTGSRGTHWNDEDRFREACVKDSEKS